MSQRRYLKPGVWTRMFNTLPSVLARLGISVYGSRVLAVRGRSSGEWRAVPVNLLEVGAARYLLAPRGETQWVRNLRARSGGELRLGTRVESFRAVEVRDDLKPPILRAYLKKWEFEVKMFFDGVGPDATDADLRRIAPGYPTFLIDPT